MFILKFKESYSVMKRYFISDDVCEEEVIKEDTINAKCQDLLIQCGIANLEKILFD